MADEKHEDKKAQDGKPTEVIGEHKIAPTRAPTTHIQRPSTRTRTLDVPKTPGADEPFYPESLERCRRSAVLSCLPRPA